MRTSSRLARCASAALLASLFLAPGVARGQQPKPSMSPAQFQEAPKLVGQNAVRIGKGMRYPRKIHGAKVEWPSGAETRSIGGVWIGQALIESDGAIHHVWVLREFIADPPWPELNEAITTAIKQWTFTPTKVNGKAVPVCLTVTVNTDLQ